MRYARLIAGIAATIAMFVVGYALPSSASAVTITNCDGEEPLREAIASGGTYDFDCPAGPHTIYLSTPIQVGGSVSLDASGDQIRIINTNQNGPLFVVQSGELDLTNFFLQNSHSGQPPEDGEDGDNGTQGTDADPIPCIAGNTGLKAENGTPGIPPPGNATDGKDGGNAEGGVIWIGDGATVSLYGGTVMGGVGGTRGGHGGYGGDGAKGGNGGDVENYSVCTYGIHGGDGASGSDGAPGGDGGDGGDGLGGGVFVSAGATLNVRDTTFDRTTAAGGGGGQGGQGGKGDWAGTPGRGSSIPFNGIAGEQAGNGARGGDGGDAGIGRGGAIYNEGLVNLVKVHFTGVSATNGGGGEGGNGGEAGSWYSVDDDSSGQGGDGGDGGDAGISEGAAIYTVDGASTNIYSAEFIKNRAGAGTDPGIGSAEVAAGGNGGDGGQSGGFAEAYFFPTGGDGGNGGDGGSASWASVAGPISFTGCAAFTNSWVPPGIAGTGGLAGEAWGANATPGFAGVTGAPGSVGQIDPAGFAPYPCDLEPSDEGPPGTDSCKDGADNDGDGFVDASDPDCQEEEDTVAPKLVLGGPKSQKLGKTVKVTVQCRNEACSVVANGIVSGPKSTRARLASLGTVKRKLSKGKKVTLKLKVGTKARKVARKALKSKRKVKARIKVTARDKAGNRRVATSQIALTIR